MRTVALAVLSVCVAALAGRSPLAAQCRSNVLTGEEIQRANVGSAYDAVQTLRPRWLQPGVDLNSVPARLGVPGPAGTPNPPASDRGPLMSIYVNEMSMGDEDYLKEIPAVRVLELRRLSPSEAAGRFGRTDGQAVIIVTLKTSP